VAFGILLLNSKYMELDARKSRLPRHAAQAIGRGSRIDYRDSLSGFYLNGSMRRVTGRPCHQRFRSNETAAQRKPGSSLQSLREIAAATHPWRFRQRPRPAGASSSL
jgi:hypothetical protein